MIYLYPRKELKNILPELKLSNTEDKVHICEACVMYWKYQHGLSILCDHLYCYCSSVAKSCQTRLWSCGLKSTRLLCPWDFPGKNTGASCHLPIQGIFQTQESNPSLRLWQSDSLPLNHQGSLWLVIKTSNKDPVTNGDSTKCRTESGRTYIRRSRKIQQKKKKKNQFTRFLVRKIWPLI